jgi:hypothetical protein
VVYGREGAAGARGLASARKSVRYRWDDVWVDGRDHEVSGAAEGREGGDVLSDLMAPPQ